MAHMWGCRSAPVAGPTPAARNDKRTIVAGISTIRARRHHRFLPVHVAVARLELGFQVHFELRKIDQVPPREIPASVFTRFMLKSGNQVDGVVAHLIRSDLRLEVERAKTALATSSRIKFRVKIK